MSTLRLSVGLLFLMLLLGLVGCSSTTRLRSATTPKIRTIASIGDRPLPIVTGEPGDAMVAERPTPERPSSRVDDRGRISGRVVDDRGEPVAEARVRLAVGSAPGGRVISASTDRAGGFTLRGLRPGTPYTLIAEYEDAQGVMTGRSKAEAPDTDVRIALAPTHADAGTEPVDPGASGETRVNHVSRRDPSGSDQEPGDEEGVEVVGSPINVEDLPPAPEAETLATASRRQARVEDEPAGPSRDEGGRRGTWTRPAVAGQDHENETDHIDENNRRIDTEFEPAPGPRSRSDFPAREFEPDDDGENPLPPALEPGQASHRPSRPGMTRVANRPVPARERAATGSRVRPRDREEPHPAPAPETTPGALVAVPPSSMPDAQSEAPESIPFPPDPSQDEHPAPVASNDATLPPPVEVTEAGAGPGPIASKAEVLPPPVESAGPGPIAKVSSASAGSSRARPRWRDLAGSQTEPPLEAAARTARIAGTSEPNANANAIRLVRGSPREPDSFCRFDPKLRRIEDFRLPDLKGRLVRFQDLDADLILLDFWGTWCQPCVRSVPHLVDLQKRIGGKQLQVVGIACEREETPPTERVADVAKMVQKLGINYTVLVSSLDGSCPLQKALHVQAYPTLILVDRQGRILWQDQGATPTTLARLDRMLTLATKTDGRRRY